MNFLKRQLEQSTSLKALIHKYQGLSKREQRLLNLMAVILIVYLLYILLWAPVKQAEQDAQTKLDNSYKTYQLLAKNAGLIASTQAASSTSLKDRSAEELQRLITPILRKEKIVAQRLNLEGDSRLQIWVEKTPYADIAIFMAQLAKEQVTIETLQFISRDVGMVDMRITLD